MQFSFGGREKERHGDLFSLFRWYEIRKWSVCDFHNFIGQYSMISVNSMALVSAMRHSPMEMVGRFHVTQQFQEKASSRESTAIEIRK